MTVDNFLLVADPYQDSLYQINVVNDSIWRLPVHRQQFSHVAYDPVEGKVYWRVGDTIRRAYLDGTAEEYFAGGDYHYRHGIAFDFVSRLWYYTTYQDRIYCIIATTLDKHYRFLVIATRNYYATDIVLDPIRRMMYWSDYENIEAAAMDGTQRTPLISSWTGRPNGLAINPEELVDYWAKKGAIDLQHCDDKLLKLKSSQQKVGDSSRRCTPFFWHEILDRVSGMNKQLHDPKPDLNAAVATVKWLKSCVETKGGRLYWYKDDTIESMTVNGKNRRVFLHAPNTIPHGITLLGEKLYYTDNSFIWSVDVSDPNTTRQQVGLASFSSIHRIAAYNSSYYMEGNDVFRACSFANGSCTNILLPTPKGLAHVTHEGYSFGSSSKWSVTKDLKQDNFLIVTDSFHDSLYQFDLESKTVWRVPFSHQGYEMSFAYDPTHLKIYWTSQDEVAIRRTNLTGTDDGTLSNLRERRDRGIAVDVVSRLVYYTDSDSIFAMKLGGGYPFSLIKAGRPRRALVLDPPRGMMYWLNGNNIEAAAMDGTKHRVITYANDYPTGLTIDSHGGRLYWSTQRTLESVALDDKNKTRLMERSDVRITGLTFLAGNLYYVDRLSRNIWKLDLSESTPTPQAVGPAIYGHISGIGAYSSDHHTEGSQTDSSCGISNGGCKDICLSTPNGPRCACWVGADFLFGSNCSATNYCASSPCRNGGTCLNKNDTFECSCVPDLYTGRSCETPIRYNYYQYGPSQGDVNIKTDPGFNCDMNGKSCKSSFVKTPKIQIFGGRYKHVKIYTNGYITFGLEYNNRNPNKLNQNLLSQAKLKTAQKGGIVMMAPLWTDNDAIYGDVYYHIYDLNNAGSTSTDMARVQHAIAHAKDDVLASSGVSVTDVSWVMVITWSQMVPRMYLSKHDSPNTFQLVIAYDPLRYQTFMMYVYKDMGWDHQYNVRNSMIGHLSLNQKDEKSLQLAPSMKSTAFLLDKQTGNTGKLGHYLFTVASGSQEINYDQVCYNWMRDELKRILTVRSYWRLTLTCPCDFRLAKADGRWKFDLKQFNATDGQRQCIYERMPRGLSTQECCYTSSGSLISSVNGHGGQLFFYHPRWQRLHEKADVMPKKWCCHLSDNCEYFYRIRPMDRCLGYTPLTIGWFYGDPHIRTLDGFQYTFNGLGEYTLIQTTYDTFTLQGRTAKTLDNNGVEREATIFSAFAARDNDSDTIHIGMTNKKDGLTVFVDNEDITGWFNSSNVDDDADYTGLSITKKNTTQLLVAFKSGFSLIIGVNAEQLDITVGAPDTSKNETKGLMGVFNGDATDDLLPPGENAFPLSNRSTEKTIFTDFGELWRIKSVDSLFYYSPGESYLTYARTDFKPLFIEDVLRDMTAERRTKAMETCGDNKECLFDFAVTGKKEAAAATLETNSKNEEVAETLSNASPNITVETVFNVTVREENLLVVRSSDSDGDDVTVTLESSPDGATFDDGVFKWTPINMEPVNISFSASDFKGGVASVDVTVNLCNCSRHGECQFDQLADGYELKQSFRVVQCNCSKGWEGDYCEADFDGCQDNPCTEGTDCTDLTADEEVLTGRLYNCSDCPSGSKKDGGICFPVNECDPKKPLHDCEQICVKQKTGVTCACEDGYRLTANKKNCSEIDECAEGTSKCEHNCTNTKGGFLCECFKGYSLNTDNITCVIDANNNNTAEECKKLNCAHGCKLNTNNTYECFCRAGYHLENDSFSCSDINECLTSNGGCVNNCTNVNGGFSCSCYDGFQLTNDKKGCNPCLSGTWGKDCKRDCNCRDSDTVCNVTTGCEECPAGFKGGDCHTDIDECAGDDNPCAEHANCTNTIGTFKCMCQAGFTQFNATVCQDLDECNSDPCDNGGDCINDVNECESSPCSNNGTCQDLVNKYRCACVRGYTGKHCETEINICGSNPCKKGGTCHQSAGKYECRCQTGTTGLNCEINVDECLSNPCQNGGTCSTPQSGKFSCQCAAGYSGPICETDIDECLGSPCQNGATCSTPQINMFSCECLTGFVGPTCETNINECQSSPCSNNGTCQDLVNSYSCTCVNGYTGGICEIDINECQSSPCSNNGTCQDLVNSYSCTCVNGYTGGICEIEIDECSSNPCMNGGTCEDEVGKFQCQCTEGYNGYMCNIGVQCVLTPCQNGATCLETNGTRTCICAAGYTGDECDIDIDECLSSPCENGGTCSTPQSNMFSCKCAAGYTGSNCDSDIDECLSNPCQNRASCSTPQTNMFSCKCLTGYVGSTCETDVDECLSNPCQNGGTCSTPQSSKFSCQCAAGYTGPICETDIDECLGSPCQNGATCSTPQINMFSCECLTGFVGLTCETNVDECGTSPCLNGGKCQDGLNTYRCVCASGYTGTHCERGQLCQNKPCTNGGTCTEIGRKRTCKCAGFYSGDNCEKSFPATLPVSKKTRLTVSVKLLDKVFSNDLTDKSSSQYKALKSKVVEALIAVLDVTLGPGKYEIDGVTFNSGSSVVTYEVVVPKNESTVIQSKIITAIKKYNGSFAGSAIDGNYVSTAETTAVRYYGQFRVPDLDYVDKYGNYTSDEYVKLAKEVRMTLSEIYQADERVGSRLVNVTDITFTKGSVVVDFFLWVDSTLSNRDVLQDILVNVPFSIGGHAVDLKSVKLSDKEIEDPDFPWLPVILGSVLAAILLTCFILLVVRKCNISSNTDTSSSIDNRHYSPTFTRRNRLWRQTSPRIPIDPKIYPQFQGMASQTYNRVPMSASQRKGNQWSWSATR
ncbi:Mucin-like protein [Lamellibrachia satsuma]|nr:Mucin-like protein [Lamellibrachia satsuma]